MNTKAHNYPAAIAGRIEELVTRFREIGDTQMRDLPLYNEKLEVEAVDFQPLGHGFIGVLITPWFMNVLILPANATEVDMNAMGKQLKAALPSGEKAMMWGGDEVIGMFKMLSLYSPMDKFGAQGQARAEAKLRLAQLMRAPKEERKTAQMSGDRTIVSRRELLRGRAT